MFRDALFQYLISIFSPARPIPIAARTSQLCFGLALAAAQLLIHLSHLDLAGTSLRKLLLPPLLLFDISWRLIARI